MAAMPKAVEILSRLHSNSLLSGFRKMPNVKTRREPKLTITPQKAAATTSHPG
jgi:hypothetical protein